jgi:hypothetical protein
MIPMVERMRLRPPIQFFQPLSHINSVLFASIAMLTVRLVDSQEGQQAASQVHGRPRRIGARSPHERWFSTGGNYSSERREALCHTMRESFQQNWSNLDLSRLLNGPTVSSRLSQLRPQSPANPQRDCQLVPQREDSLRIQPRPQDSGICSQKGMSLSCC